MPLEQLESILKQLSEGKGLFVDPKLKLIYTAHYNEVLLYKNLEEMFSLYRKYGFVVNVLSNGVALTPSRVDILKNNMDVINEVLLNIPSADEETWSKYVNMNRSLFKKVVSNVLYAKDIVGDKLRVMVNGLDSRSIFSNGGWVEIMSKAPDIDLDVNSGTLKTEVENLRKLFPGVTVFPNHHLYDRAGHLEDLGVISQSAAISKYLNKDGMRVVGCSGGLIVRDRAKDWVHINANGDFFICCDDFDFETIYDNINENSLSEIWSGYNRELMVEQAKNSICTRCSAAIWGNIS